MEMNVGDMTNTPQDSVSDGGCLFLCQRVWLLPVSRLQQRLSLLFSNGCRGAAVSDASNRPGRPLT